MIKTTISFVAGLLVTAILSTQVEANTADEYRLVKSHDVQPSYPRSALRQQIEGWVDLRVTVSPDGEIEEIEVVDAEPRRVFERAAVRAASQWQFEPPRLAGVSESSGGIYRIQFALN